MSGFRFGLEKVLEMRLKEEQKQARIMADARKDAKAARQAVTDLEALRNAGRERLTGAHGTGRSVGHLQNLEWVLQRMEKDLEVAEAVASQADATASQRMQEFRQAVQDRQSLDCLKDRQRTEWTAAERAKEQKSMDELALTRHVRGGALTGTQEEKTS